MRDIPLSSAVIAAQPCMHGRGRNSVKPGAIDLFRWGDRAADDYSYTGGAVYISAHGDPSAQMNILRADRRELVRTYGFTADEVDEVLERIPEYRQLKRQAKALHRIKRKRRSS